MKCPSESQCSTMALLLFFDPSLLSRNTRNAYPQLFLLLFALITVTLEFLFKNVRSETSRYGRSSAGWFSASCLPLLAVVEK